MWHKGLTVREVTLSSEGGLFEYMKQLVKQQYPLFLHPSSALEQGTPSMAPLGMLIGMRLK